MNRAAWVVLVASVNGDESKPLAISVTVTSYVLASFASGSSCKAAWTITVVVFFGEMTVFTIGPRPSSLPPSHSDSSIG